MSPQFIYKKWQEDKGIAYTWWETMFTRIDIILSGHEEKELETIVDIIVKELNDLEKTCSYFDKSSELYQLNNCKNTVPVLVSNELYAIINNCMDYYHRTNGYFDITIMSDKYNEPAMQYIKLFPEEKTICYEKEGIHLDLSGFLKGYALEKIRNILNENNIKDALVNMGNSSVLALGNHPFGEGWKIKYNESYQDTDEAEVILKNQCFTTSGNETIGRKHIINPLTGEYIKGKNKISVVTEKGTDGEALSTALFAAGYNNYDKILQNFPDARILINNIY